VKLDEQIKNFWDCFSSKEEFFYSNLLRKETREATLSALNLEIAVIDDVLCFELGRVGEQVELVLSASGVKESFPIAKKVSQLMPELNLFTLTTLKQPLDLSTFKYCFKETTIFPSSVCYCLKENRRLFEVEMFFDGFDSSKKQIFIDASYAFLDAAIGELEVATSIGNVTVAAKENSKLPSSSLLPFSRFKSDFTDQLHLLNNSILKLSEATRAENLKHKMLESLESKLASLAGKNLSAEFFFILPNSRQANGLLAEINKYHAAVSYSDIVSTINGDAHSVVCYFDLGQPGIYSLQNLFLKMSELAIKYRGCLEELSLDESTLLPEVVGGL
jgi:hypothetical protein